VSLSYYSLLVYIILYYYIYIFFKQNFIFSHFGSYILNPLLFNSELESESKSSFYYSLELLSITLGDAWSLIVFDKFSSILILRSLPCSITRYLIYRCYFLSSSLSLKRLATYAITSVIIKVNKLFINNVESNASLPSLTLI